MCDNHIKLSVVVENKPPMLHNVSLEALTKMSDDNIRTNAGGVYNHELYFASLTPDDTEPSERMMKLIDGSFGSEKEMWNEIIEAGLGIVGSGLPPFLCTGAMCHSARFSNFSA